MNKVEKFISKKYDADTKKFTFWLFWYLTFRLLTCLKWASIKSQEIQIFFSDTAQMLLFLIVYKCLLAKTKIKKYLTF